jgi:TonB family protein
LSLWQKETPGIMTLVPENSPFSLLPDKRPPWTQFFLSMSTQGVALLAVTWVGLIYPAAISMPEHDYHFVQLVNTPPPVSHQPAPLRVFKTPVVEEPRPETLRLPPEIRHRVQPDELPTAPKVNLAATKPVPLTPSTPAIPRQLVKTNVFSTGSSATPTIAAAPQKVQTGGFGDPNGVPARENNGKPVTIARLGSFDLPSGPGYGNGTGGASGVRGVVASAGFGNGIAIGDGSGKVNATRGTVRQAGFGDAEPAAAVPVRMKQVDNSASKTVSAEIISKPTPVYTDEARHLKIEGEVLLEVVFESGGKVRVVRVVRGLGHGLDESAMRAAEQIRFKPAQLNGQPVDFSAVLHILFQLA